MDQPLSIVIILGVMAQGQGLANNAGWYTRRKPLPIVRGQHRLSFPSLGTHCCSLSGTDTLAVLLPVTQLLCKWSLAKKFFLFFLAWVVMVSDWGVGKKGIFNSVWTSPGCTLQTNRPRVVHRQVKWQTLARNPGFILHSLSVKVLLFWTWRQL